MLSSELISALQTFTFKKYFAGIFSADTIPLTLKDNHFLILNTDVKSGPGKHWYGVVRIKNVIECFDSLGIQENQNQFLLHNFNFKGITHIHFNQTQVQPFTSPLCGQFVLFYLFERYHNHDFTFDDLLNEIFCEDLAKNDIIVQDFIRNFIHS
ncbi:MAG: hypothetical protein FJ333_10330 [Sphingomonadales bacterium]|nr:hypothetical protein [Sphingomonadales bacterium]